MSKAWAIDLRLDGRANCWLGVLGYEPKPEPWRDGMRTCLWRTRVEARKALAFERQKCGEWSRANYWNRATVVPVNTMIAPRSR